MVQLNKWYTWISEPIGLESKWIKIKILRDASVTVTHRRSALPHPMPRHPESLSLNYPCINDSRVNYLRINDSSIDNSGVNQPNGSNPTGSHDPTGSGRICHIVTIEPNGSNPTGQSACFLSKMCLFFKQVRQMVSAGDLKNITFSNKKTIFKNP